MKRYLVRLTDDSTGISRDYLVDASNPGTAIRRAMEIDRQDSKRRGLKPLSNVANRLTSTGLGIWIKRMPKEAANDEQVGQLRLF